MNEVVAISVLIPVYNSELFIRETIDSVLVQTFEDFELLLMDDGSTDNTSDIIRSYDDPRIVYEWCPHDFIGTVNHGLDKARGKYIAFLDHDDLMIPDRLRIQYDFMERREWLDACGGWMRTFGVKATVWPTPIHYPQILLEYLRIRLPAVCNPTGFIRKSVIDKYNIRYRRGYSFAADSVFWLDLMKVGKFEALPYSLVWYRTSDTQTSIIALPEAKKSAMVMHQELINYLVSKLDDKEEIKGLIINDMMPVLYELADLSFFSTQIFFSFIEEILEGLYANGFLNLDEPLGLSRNN